MPHSEAARCRPHIASLTIRATWRFGLTQPSKSAVNCALMAVCRVPMKAAALHRLIQSRHERPHRRARRFLVPALQGSANVLQLAPHRRENPAIREGPPLSLPGAFRSRFGIGHDWSRKKGGRLPGKPALSMDVWVRRNHPDRPGNHPKTNRFGPARSIVPGGRVELPTKGL